MHDQWRKRSRPFGSHQRSQAAAVVPGIALARRCRPPQQPSPRSPRRDSAPRANGSMPTANELSMNGVLLPMRVRERARQFLRAAAGVIDMPPPNAMRQKWRIPTLRGSANEFICHFCAQANSARTFQGRTECFGRHPQAIGVFRCASGELARGNENEEGAQGEEAAALRARGVTRVLPREDELLQAGVRLVDRATADQQEGQLHLPGHRPLDPGLFAPCCSVDVRAGPAYATPCRPCRGAADGDVAGDDECASAPHSGHSRLC